MNTQKFFIEHALYPAMEHLKGNHIRSYFRELCESARLTPQGLRDLQRERLGKLLTACVASVPAYQGLGITQAAIDQDPFAVLAGIPLLSKREFQKDPERYVNQDFDPALRIVNRTGGSTGEPLKFYMDRFDVEHYEAARWRGLSWWGITFGSRSVMIWGNPIELSQKDQRQAKFKDQVLKNRTILSAYDLTSEKMDEYIAFLNRYQPEYLYGYATALYTFASLVLPRREQLHLKHLKAVVSTSETLHDYQRKAIEEAFSCPVVNEYGARDAGILAYQCPCGQMHITAENVILEVLNPETLEPAKPGESGLVVTTDLNNFAMPRLRYLLGDTATLGETRTCPQGISLPVIAHLDGREDAIFKLPDGKLVHGNFINQLSRKYQTLAQFQLVQHDPTHADLKVVLKEGAGQQELEPFAKDVASFLPGVTVAPTAVDAIPVSASGKFRYSIREFPL